MEDTGSQNTSSDPEESPDQQDRNGNAPGAMKRERTAAEIRKSNKPLMEKRRRERINTCLDQLKSILMDVTKKESSYYSKLEKADILEMTVKYLKNVKRQQLQVAMANDPSVLSKYIAGFNECASEVSKYLNTVDGLTAETRSRLLNHLANILHKNSTSVSNPSPVNPGVQFAIAGSTSSAATAIQSLAVPSATPLNSLPGSGMCILNAGASASSSASASAGSAASASGIQTLSAPMQLVPARLPSGETVFLLTNSQSFGMNQSQTNGGMNLNVPVIAQLPSSSNSSPMVQIVGAPVQAHAQAQAQAQVNLNVFQHGLSVSLASSSSSSSSSLSLSTSSRHSIPSATISSPPSSDRSRMEESSTTAATTDSGSSSVPSVIVSGPESSPTSTGNTSGSSSGPPTSPLCSPQLSSTPVRIRPHDISPAFRVPSREVSQHAVRDQDRLHLPPLPFPLFSHNPPMQFPVDNNNNAQRPDYLNMNNPMDDPMWRPW